MVTQGYIIIQGLSEILQIRDLTRTHQIIRETILLLTVNREELFLLPAVQFTILFRQEEVLKADRAIPPVPLTDHPVLNREVPILQGIHPGHHQALPVLQVPLVPLVPQVLIPVLHQVLHRAGDRFNNTHFSQNSSFHLKSAGIVLLKK